MEVREAAFRSATATIERLGLADRVTVLHGDSTQITLPEPADVCVSELIGMIGSSEGVVPILNDALATNERRRNHDSAAVRHQIRSVQVARLACPPEVDRLAARLHPGSVHEDGPLLRPPCLHQNCPSSNILADPLAFEDLEFSSPADPNATCEVTFTLTSNSRLDGFLCWLNLYTDSSHMVDSLVDRLSWLPVYLPAFDPGITVAAGDVVRVRCVTTCAAR